MSLSPLRYALWLAVLWLAVAVVLILPGRLWLTGHMVDYLHTLDMAYRVLEGDRPHVDFMTPLGVFSVLPISLFLDVGYGPGMAYHLAQLLVTLVALPGIWWIGVSRLEGWARIAYGAGMVLLGTAMVYGGDNPALTASMYYNRWAWVVASFVVLMVMVPPRPGWKSARIDGLLLGAAGAALLLVKVTYVMGLAPIALFYLASRRSVSLMLSAVTGFALVAGPVTAWLGTGFWAAYVGDLLAVAGGTQRQYPGLSLPDLLASPPRLPVTLIVLAAIVFWRRSELQREGLALLILAPGLYYITYQNWGNDPQWLFLLGLILFTFRPDETARPVFGHPAKQAASALAALCFILVLPSWMNVAGSHLRHMSQSPEQYVPLFRDVSKADVQLSLDAADSPTALTLVRGFARDGIGPDGDEPAYDFLGETLEYCSLERGLHSWTSRMLDQLGAIEEAVGRRVMVADVYDYLWLIGPFQRLPHAAPWYYEIDEGFEDAELVLVPYCPVGPGMRNSKLDIVKSKGWVLEEVIRTDLFILARRAG